MQYVVHYFCPNNVIVREKAETFSHAGSARRFVRESSRWANFELDRIDKVKDGVVVGNLAP